MQVLTPQQASAKAPLGFRVCLLLCSLSARAQPEGPGVGGLGGDLECRGDKVKGLGRVLSSLLLVFSLCPPPVSGSLSPL